MKEMLRIPLSNMVDGALQFDGFVCRYWVETSWRDELATVTNFAALHDFNGR